MRSREAEWSRNWFWRPEMKSRSVSQDILERLDLVSSALKHGYVYP